MSLRRVGFFRELPHGFPDGLSLRESRGVRPQSDEERIVAYLKEGALLVACPGVVGDVLDPRVADAQNPVDPIGSPHILTDGAWAWPADLEYYVRTYHVALPTEFVEHMRDHQWRPPAEGELDFAQLLGAFEK